MTTVSQSRPARSRRTARPSGDDREQAILVTAERLLEERPFTEISVDDLAKGAGISRPTFYFYFASKDAVLLALFEQVITEADSVFERHAQNPPTDRYDAWRSGINVFFETFVKHKGVTRAAHEVRASNSAVRDLLATYMAKWIDSTAATIEAERTQGGKESTSHGVSPGAGFRGCGLTGTASAASAGPPRRRRAARPRWLGIEPRLARRPLRAAGAAEVRR